MNNRTVTFDKKLGSYVPGIFHTLAASEADKLYLHIQHELAWAFGLARDTQTALFKVKTHYDAFVNDSENPGTVFKHAALRASHQAYRDAFEYAIGCVLYTSERLAGLMPQLKADCAISAREDVVFLRKCNTVACALLLKDVEARIRTMQSSCSLRTLENGETTDTLRSRSDELKADVSLGWQDLAERFRVVGAPRREIFFADLDIPFIEFGRGVQAYDLLQQWRNTLESAMERCLFCLQHFFNCKSVFFNNSANLRWLDACNSFEERFILDREEESVINYQRSRWALQVSITELTLALEGFESATQNARDYAIRNRDASRVVLNNIVAAQAQAYRAAALRDRAESQLIQTPNERGGTDSRQAVVTAFENLPEVFEAPSGIRST